VRKCRNGRTAAEGVTDGVSTDQKTQARVLPTNSQLPKFHDEVQVPQPANTMPRNRAKGLL